MHKDACFAQMFIYRYLLIVWYLNASRRYSHTVHHIHVWCRSVLIESNGWNPECRKVRMCWKKKQLSFIQRPKSSKNLQKKKKKFLIKNFEKTNWNQMRPFLTYTCYTVNVNVIAWIFWKNALINSSVF